MVGEVDGLRLAPGVCLLLYLYRRPDERQSVSRTATRLLPLLARGEPTRQYAYFRNKDGSQYGVRDGRWKLLVHGKEDPEIELFDLDADPGERRNLAAQHTEQVVPLLRILSTWRKETVALRPRRTDQTDLDVKTRKQLEALGYVGD